MADEKKAKKTKKAAEAAAAPEESPAEPPAASAEPVPSAEPSVEPPQAPQEIAAPVESSSFSNPINASNDLQRLEEKAKKAEELHAAEVKVRKELEALNAKLLAEKTALLDSLSGEKGQLQDFQERNAKLTAQKNDLENQLRVSSQHLKITQLPMPSKYPNPYPNPFNPLANLSSAIDHVNCSAISRVPSELLMCALCLNLAHDRWNILVFRPLTFYIYIYIHIHVVQYTYVYMYVC